MKTITLANPNRFFLTFCVSSLLLVGITLFSGNTYAFAQPAQPQQPVNSEQLELEYQLSKDYDRLIEAALLTYFHPETYVVNTRVEVVQRISVKDFKIVQNLDRPASANLPGLPYIPRQLAEEAQSDPVISLRDSLSPTQKDILYDISKVSVNVLVDSSYTPDNTQFIEEYVILKAGLDILRGDRVMVEERGFPQRKWPSNRAIGAPALNENGFSADSTAAASTMDTLQDWMKNPLFWWIFGGLLGLTLILLIWAIRNRNKARVAEAMSSNASFGGRNAQQSQPQFAPQPTSFAPQAFAQSPQSNGPLSQQAQYPTSFTPQPTAQALANLQALEDLRTEVIRSFISEPKRIATLFESWNRLNNDEGLRKATETLAAADPNLLKILQGHLPLSTQQELQFRLHNLAALSSDDQQRILESFRNELNKLRGSAASLGNGSESNSTNSHAAQKSSFGFLRQLNNQQIQHLLKEESSLMRAILLSQLSGDISAQILQKMDYNTRMETLIEMGKVGSVPVSLYKTVAQHFSKKALDIYDIKQIPAGGVESVLDMIYSMPLDQQESYVNGIMERDLDLAVQIREQLVTFEDLPSMPPSRLQTALESIDTETLTQALIGAPESIRSSVLNARAKRERQLILSELQTSEEQDVDAADIDRARRTILAALRNHSKGTLRDA